MPKINEQARRNLMTRYLGLGVAGRDGYFTPDQDAAAEKSSRVRFAKRYGLGVGAGIVESCGTSSRRGVRVGVSFAGGTNLSDSGDPRIFVEQNVIFKRYSFDRRSG